MIAPQFWWPEPRKDFIDFIGACSASACGKTSRQPPASLLRPLSVPSRTWSHISLYFITALPTSHGKSVIVTVVDRFSKLAHCIPPTKLLSSLETAQLLIKHVFLIHGIPVDLVSDWGQEFGSQIWRKFCRAMGATTVRQSMDRQKGLIRTWRLAFAVSICSN